GQARDDGTVARALAHLVNTIGNNPARKAEAQALVPVAEGAIARSGNKATDLAQLELGEGRMLYGLGDYAAALDHLERALVLAEKGNVESLQIASLLNNLGVALDSQGRYDEAKRTDERALAIDERELGPDHLFVASPLNNLATVELKLGDYDAA